MADNDRLIRLMDQIEAATRHYMFERGWSHWGCLAEGPQLTGLMLINYDQSETTKMRVRALMVAVGVERYAIASEVWLEAEKKLSPGESARPREDSLRREGLLIVGRDRGRRLHRLYPIERNKDGSFFGLGAELSYSEMDGPLWQFLPDRMPDAAVQMTVRLLLEEDPQVEFLETQ